MASIFLSTAGQVLTLFLLISVGFALKKLKKLSRESMSHLTFLLLYVVSPCLIVRAMEQAESNAIREFLYTGVGCLVYFAVGVAVGLLFYRKLGADKRAVLRFASVYPNNGFMGYPLVLGVFGAAGAVSATAFLIVVAVIQWTHGVTLMGGRENASLRHALVNPGTLAFAAGAVLFATRVTLPPQIDGAVSFFADVNTPLAMVIIGAQMADANLKALLRAPALYFSAFLKLLALPALAALILYPLHMPPIAYCVSVVLAATPTAGMTSMFAERFRRDTATAAQAVSLTTLFSIVTLPIFVTAIRAVTHWGA
ncbi:MAG: AEC family transporter [Oscillospiraceae bacterium]|jgi:predicted permease|nr:AEC family transporter [Oscillospiraceae bacterium]